MLDLLDAFHAVLERLTARPPIDIEREELSVEAMMAKLWGQVRGSWRVVSFSDLFCGMNSRRAVVTAFLALLELARVRAILLMQDQALGEILVCANPQYELSEPPSIG